eukprot:362342-Chlamydomonas_euryale.AAC.2
MEHTHIECMELIMLTIGRAPTSQARPSHPPSTRVRGERSGPAKGMTLRQEAQQWSTPSITPDEGGARPSHPPSITPDKGVLSLGALAGTSSALPCSGQQRGAAGGMHGRQSQGQCRELWGKEEGGESKRGREENEFFLRGGGEGGRAGAPLPSRPLEKRGVDRCGVCECGGSSCVRETKNGEQSDTHAPGGA